MSGAMTEFRITSDLSALRSAVIDANFDEVRVWLEENLEPYRTMEVTQDAIPQAKTYRANIRKVKDRIEQSRKEAKNAALAAYAEFETKCKALTGLCDEAANAIDNQVKAFENAEKEMKINALRAVYDDAVTEETGTYLTWERIFNPKWENKGYPAETAKAEILIALQETEKDLETIRTMGEGDTPYLLDVYRQTHDVSAVVRKASELKTMREREEQRRREAEERKRAAEAEFARRRAEEAAAWDTSSVAAATASHQGEAGDSATVSPEGTAADAGESQMVTVSFRVTCSKAQLKALGQYMRDNRISYGRA